MKETHKVIDIDVGAAQTSIKDLRKEMSGLRDALLNLKEGTEEYEKVQNKLVEDQRRIDSVMKATKKDIDSLPGSYNAIQKELKEVKAAWKATNDEATRNELGKRAAELNNQLKELDSSIGNYQRNVGNYQNAFKGAFTSILTGSKSATGGINGLNAAVSALGGPMGLVVSATTALASAFFNSRKGTIVLDNALIGLESTAQGVIKVFDKMTFGVFHNGLKKANDALDEHKRKLEDSVKVLKGFSTEAERSGSSISQSFNKLKDAAADFKHSLDAIEANPIILVVAAIGALVAAMKNNERAMNNMKAGFKSFQPVISSFHKALGDLGSILGRLIDSLGKALQPLMPVITKLMNGFVSVVRAAAMGLNLVITAVGKVVKAISSTLSPAIKKVTGVFKDAGDFVMNVINTVVNAGIKGINFISKSILTFWNFLKPLVAGIATFIAGVIDTIINTCSAAINIITSSILTIYNGIVSVFSTIVKVVSGPIEKVINLVIDGINIITKTVASIYNSVVEVVDSIVSFLVTPVEKMVNLVIDGINTIIKTFSTIYNAITGTVGKAFDFVATGFDLIVNTIIRGLNVVIKSSLTGIENIAKPFANFISYAVGAVEGLLKVINKIPFVNVENSIDRLDAAKNKLRNFTIDVDKATISEINLADKVKSAFDSIKVDVDKATISHASFADRVKDAMGKATIATDKFKLNHVEFAKSVKNSLDDAKVSTDAWALGQIDLTKKVRDSFDTTKTDVNKWAIEEVDVIKMLKAAWSEWSEDIASDNDKVINSIAALEKRRNDLTEAFNNAEIKSDEWYSLAKQIKEVEAQLKEYYKVLEEGEGEAAIVSEYTQALAGSYAALELKHKELLDQWKNASSEQERSILGEEIEEVEAEMKKMQETLGKLKEVSVGVSSEVIIVAGSYNELKQRLRELQEEWSNTDKATNPERFQELSEQIKATKEQIAEFEEALKNEGVEVENLTEEVLVVAGSYKALKEERKKLQEEWENTNADTEPERFKQLSEAIMDVDEKLKKYEDSLRGTALESQDADSKVTALVGSYNYLSQQLKDIETQWANTNSQAKRDILEKKAAAIRAEMDRMKGVLKDVGVEVVAMSGSYNDLQKQLDAVRQKWQASADPKEQERLGKIIQVLEKRIEKLNETLKPEVEIIEELNNDVAYLSTSYKYLSEQLSLLKDQWESAGTEAERQAIAEKIKIVQEQLDKMNESLKKSKDETTIVAGSYKELSNRLDELKKQWENAADDDSRKRISREIEDIEDKMKEMGDVNTSTLASLIPGYSNLSRTIELLKNPVKTAEAAVHGLSRALKQMLLNPVAAFFLAIVAAVKLIKAGFDSSSEASNKLKVAFAALDPVVNAIKGSLAAVANVIGDIIGLLPKLVQGVQSAGLKIAELLNKIGLVSDEKLAQYKANIDAMRESMDISQDIARREIALEDRRRNFLITEAMDEEKIAELRVKAAEKNKYTQDEILKFLEEAKDKELALAKEREAIAKEEMDIEIARFNELKKAGAITDADEDRRAEAIANYYKVRKETQDKIRTLNKSIAANEKETNTTIKEEVDKTLEHERDALKERQSMYEQGTLRYLQYAESIEEVDWKIQLKRLQNEKYTDEQIFAFREAHEKRLADIREAISNVYRQDVEEEDIDEDSALEYLMRINEKKIALSKEYSREYYELLRQQSEFEYDQERIRLEVKGATDEELELLELEHQKRLTDIAKEEGEKRFKEQYALWEATVDGMSEMAKESSNALSSIGDAWESVLEAQLKTGKISEKEYETRKKNLQKFQIAAIVAQTASSIFDVWAGYAKEIGVINAETAAATGPAAAATKAALDAKSMVSAIAKTTALSATSVAQIAAVKSNGVSKGNNAVSATAIPDTAGVYSGPTYTRNLQTDQERAESRAPIYVRVTDINEVQNTVRVRESESTF